MSKDTKQYKIGQFKPIWDNLIIKPIDIEDDGAFVRPVQKEDKPEIGIVVDMSKELEKDFKIGQAVLFNRYSTFPALLGGELIVKAEDIVAKEK